MNLKYNFHSLKKKYTDLRYGYVTVAPILTYSNFLILAYNFTQFKDIPFPIFTMFFSFALITSLVLLGQLFRKQQLSVDEDLRYERSKEMAKTQRIILQSLDNVVSDSQTKILLQDRIKYLESIENQTS